MADYHAVLQRTLSGFSDPKPQLRTKLYERARVTIKRQLEGRTPALSADAMAAELDKLEGAITQIEQGFDPSYGGPQVAAPEPAFVPPPGPDLTAVPPLPTAANPIEAEPSAVRPTAVGPTSVAPSAVERTIVDSSVGDATPVETSSSELSPPSSAATTTAVVEAPQSSPAVQATPVLPPIPEFVPPSEHPAQPEPPMQPEPVAQVEPPVPPEPVIASPNPAIVLDGETGVPAAEQAPPSAPPFDPLSDLAIPAPPAAAVEVEATPVPETAAPVPSDPVASDGVFGQTVDPLDQWAKEFMGAQESVPENAPEAAQATPQESMPEMVQEAQLPQNPQPAPLPDPVTEFLSEPAPAPTVAPSNGPNSAPLAAPEEAFTLPPIPDFDPVPVDHTAQEARRAAPVVETPDPAQASLDPVSLDPAAPVLPAEASLGGVHAGGAVSPPPSDPMPLDFGAQPAASPFQPVDDGLTIPPAPGFGEPLPERRRKGGFFKWLLLLLVLAGLAAAAWYGWTNREQVMEQLGLADNGVKPTPVRTITIKPEPAETEPEITPAQSDDAGAAEPKAEDRLTPDGNGGAISTQPVQPTLPPTVTVPESGAQGTGDQQSDAVPSGETGLPVSQNAILYEEGSNPTDNTVVPGRVIWSTVQEEPAAGQPKEAAIRGRVEIPDRNMVLIMTIKRNADQALPASHLIELVFAVPDDFAGGSIGEINRFVMKESEQGRGEGLVAVPARIADGIFLIALNNLPEAVTTNTNLLRDRPWIDIPLQYRTGRRALVTIEKGTPGEQVFEEVFAAWGTPAPAQ
ncbi:MAG: hypothetical protein AAF903_14830 [Pseudomonadota bacterium]